MARFHVVFSLPVIAVLMVAGCRGKNASSGEAAPDAATQRRAIVALLTGQMAAWNRGDVAGFMESYGHSDSLVFIDRKGPTYGWQQNLAISEASTRPRPPWVP